MKAPLLIDRSGVLAQFAARARQQRWLGVDTEFVRDRTYFPRAGLIQIATPEEIALVDPVRLHGLAALEPLLFDSAMPKILHAASQDLELFVCLFDRLPTRVFDTQVAAACLGYAPQIGHGDLVEKLLQAATPPALGRYNWLRRPLEDKAIDYAAGDVMHLGALYRRLHEELRRANRLPAFEAAMQKLRDPDRYRPHPEVVWRRVHHARRLNEGALRRLKRLARWREEQAIRQNRPRQWVLRDKLLVVLAKRAPHSGAELAEIRLLNARARNRYGDSLLALISETG